MISIEIRNSTKGIPTRESLQKEKEAKDYYDLGRAAAEAEVKKASADIKHAVADMYAAMIIAQAKAMLNSTLVDIARTLGEVKAQSAMLQGFLQGGNTPPSLTPLVGNPALVPPPLPVESQANINNVGLPPLPIQENPMGGSGPTPMPQIGLPGGGQGAPGSQGLPVAGGPM